MKNRTIKISLLSSVLLLSVANTNLFAATCPQTSSYLFCVDSKDTSKAVFIPSPDTTSFSIDNGSLNRTKAYGYGSNNLDSLGGKDTGINNVINYNSIITAFAPNSTGKHFDANLINYATAKVTLEDSSGNLVVSNSTKFDTKGTTTFKSGSKLFIDVASSATGNYDGQKISDVIKAQTLTIEDSTLKLEDNSALLDFTYTATATSLDLNVKQAQTVGNTIASDNKNARNAAVVLQNIIDNSGNYPQMNSVITALNGLSSNEAVAKAVDSTTPQTTTSSFTASNQISNNVSNIVTQRQNINLNGTGLNSGDDMLSEKNIWVKPYGSLGAQKNKDGVNGFDINTYGIGLGFDAEIKENQQIGLGLFYTKADVNVNNVSQNSDINVYSLVLYGNSSIIDDKTNLLYQIAYSLQDTSSQRDIDFLNTSAKADYKSHIATLDLRLLRDMQINSDTLLQPFVSTLYRHFKSPSYNEQGAGSLNLNVNSFSSSELIFGVGTLVHYKINDNSKIFSNVNIGYDLKDDNNIVSSSYQGASGLSFETQGIDNGRWSYDLGLGYENSITELSNINFSYNFQGQGTSYTNHIFSAKYNYKF
ncbi:autotransporter domain-containing protein [Aliarcobacter skirrowii]|uniref:autotransporter family protein n=1 Tax=Aliarcobacter skirrowii TaxID=28200 RepID=UPI0029A48182|nr:autotransporter domain-containing protein [Aliarcobacter skirrowii]MDX4048306.1 autotransporter domain-containing protein [Aliarcobacter skirrowii]